MAMIRALWKLANHESVPDFKEEPYDLGSFADIAHYRGGSFGRVDTFHAGFDALNPSNGGVYSFDATFSERGTAPFPTYRRIANTLASVESTQTTDSISTVFRVSGKEWQSTTQNPFDDRLAPMYWGMVRKRNTEPFENEQWKILERLANYAFRFTEGPFASAPVRSKPRRTYDPRTAGRDPEGDYVPMYLADLFRQTKKTSWTKLRRNLEEFGKSAGLFDEIQIRPLGRSSSEPFQVRVRKRGQKTVGQLRNIIDVGYGVSQVLPVITELLREDAPPMFLLQQPEVHLHPSAQAALGTLFCAVAADGPQIVVETHSDHLINRVRLDIRDGKVPLKSEDVSLLYFERKELEVDIHSLRVDELGNVIGAPPGYRFFFAEETARSLRYRSDVRDH